MIRSSLRIALLLLLPLAATPVMAAYTVVNTSAPAINCVFSTTCSTSVTDLVSTMPNGGRIQSRVFQGQPGSTAAGKWVYEYRINMSDAVGILSIPYVRRMAISYFGPVLSYDYDFNGTATDQVFVITSGGIGTIGLASSYVLFNWTYFNPSSYVYGGSYPGNGQSSYFFGVVSNYPPVTKSGSVETDAGWVTVTVYAPAAP